MKNKSHHIGTEVMLKRKQRDTVGMTHPKGSLGRVFDQSRGKTIVLMYSNQGLIAEEARFLSGSK